MAAQSISKFNHPYTPYDVQLQFMQAVYDILDEGDGQIGILESPTGTGKSLSLICASLTWLRRHQANAYEYNLEIAPDKASNEPAWVVSQLLESKRKAILRAWQDREERLGAARAKEEAEEARAAASLALARNAKKRRVEKDSLVADDDEWMLDDVGGGQEGAASSSGLSLESREFLGRMGLGPPAKRSDDDEGSDGIIGSGVKIFFTSRTHSQLSQFICELRRPSFPPSIPPSILSSMRPCAASEPVKVLPLSSRQRLCINPAVASLPTLSAINDRCSELQDGRSKKKCPFMPTQANLASTHRFRDAALATLPDIEDLHRLGTEHSVCPYYASRTALPAAEVVVLPYPLLLQRSAREALGIELRGNVVIIDEAHNIMDAVAGVHSCEVKLSEIRRAREMLGVYVRRFGKRLGSEKRVLVGRVGRVVEGLRVWMEGALNFKDEHGCVDTGSLLGSKGIDQINLFELIRYMQESKLAYKIESYVSHVQESEARATALSSHMEKPLPSKRSTTPVLHTLVSFLTALTNLSTEGRIFYRKIGASDALDMQLSYLLLSPTHAFSPLTSARALVLAGGTMSPFSDYAAHLFPLVPSEKLTTLSCAHVVPGENLLVWTLSQSRANDPSSTLEFTYSKRGGDSIVKELGLSVLNVCKIVPDGVVAFFPSYGYLDEVVRRWQAGGSTSIWGRLASKKMIFRETKGSTSDEMLQEYSSAILSPSVCTRTTGALLLSVIGGKLSEGINFSDRLGRAILVIGLPFPNPSSPEWIAKSSYVESTVFSQLTTAGTLLHEPSLRESDARSKAKGAAREFYENACMRAVNQSVGRAIRHKGDYAAIILVDRRYAGEGVRNKLSGWVRNAVRHKCEEGGLAELMSGLGAFFGGKKKSTQLLGAAL